ncbi:MAG: SH3 domain-containing protein [Clostridia bacterium]|nr:SH3 domain-containing protein [Clostridia bacterium]
MTSIKKIFSFLLIFSILISALFTEFSFGVSAATVTNAYINGDAINVRQGPGTSYKKVEQISYRQVTVLATEGQWLKIRYMNSGEEKTGYIYNDSGYVYIDKNDPDLDFNSQLANFPESYRAALTELHNKYPNWKFVPDNVNCSFEQAVQLQMSEMRKQVQLEYHPISWRSMGKGAYDWSTGKWIDTNGGWTGASREIIRYYMDPRNFLNSSEIYMFLMQSYGNVTYTAEGLKSIVANSFLDTEEYINIILNAGKTAGISPYIIASKIIQEQGPQGGDNALVSGKYGYYNFFNFGASGSGNQDVITEGIEFAKKNGWDTKEKSIVGGAKQLADGYVEVGQDTYYYQDFNVHFTGKLWHQYAQAVHDARGKGASLKKEYEDKVNYTLVFRIPVFKDMPAVASPKPVENSNQNNYYFNSISVSGLTPSFYRYTYNYDLHVTGDTIIDVSIPSTASISCALEFPLKAGNNKVVLKVRSQSGYDNDYTINVNADQNCTLYINKGNANVSGGTSQVKGKGDINGDGKITVSDMATVRLHLLGKYTLSGDTFKSADVNGDGKITVSDMATVRLHLLGKYTIS